MAKFLPYILIGLLALFALTLSIGPEKFRAESGSLKPITIIVEKDEPTHATTTTPAHPDGAAATWTYSKPIVIEKDVAVSRIEVSMDGAPPETIHHLSVVRLGQPDAICSDGSHELNDEIYTVSRNNLDPVEFPEPYGVHLEAGDVLQVEFMEHTRHEPHGPGGTYHHHALEVKLFVEEQEERPIPLEFIRPRLDDSPCAYPVAHQAFVVPVGEEEFVRESSGYNDGQYLFTEDGLILHRSANFWPDKGGQSMSMYLNGEEVDRFLPINLDKPWLFSIPNQGEPIPVSAGDILTIDAVYKNPFETPIKDAAGILGFYFAPNRPAPDGK